MAGELTSAELNGLLDSISNERHEIPSCVKQSAGFDADSLANARLRNKSHWLADGFGSEIARHLRHIPVNPHNFTASELLRKSYVFSKMNVGGEAEEVTLNISDASMASFISDLVASAKKERAFSTNPGGTNSTIESLFVSCVHVVKGERGVGKTFFLNYALTRFNDELDREKTIWVRLNLVYSSGFEDDLEYWMQAQAAKIILRYYDVKSSISGKKAVNASDALFRWIENNSRFTSEDRSRLRSALRSMEQVFGRGTEDEVLRPALCDKEICRELYRYMRETGWSFIFVLDGFDQLDINPEQVTRFDKIQSNVKRFISMRAAFGAAVVIVSRTNTFDDFRAYDPFKGIPARRSYRIGDVDFSRVVRKRFAAIREVVIRQIPFNRRDQADKLESTIKEFLQDWEVDGDVLKTNSRVNSSNIRAKLQTLYLMFLNFASESTGKGYLVLEHMILNGMRYPALAYEYSEASKDELVPRVYEVSHEARFLPLVTRYPLPSTVGVFAKPKNPLKHLLVEIRIMQLCLAAQDLQNDQETLSIGELTSILTKCFGYMHAIAVAAINELAAFDVLRIIRREGLPTTSPSNGIKVLPKASYILNECIHDVAYLNMSAMRTPLPEEYFKYRFVQAGFIDQSLHSRQGWVDKKISNSLALFGTLIFQNRVERALLKGHDWPELSERERSIMTRAAGNGMWNLIPAAKAKVVVETMQILTSGPVGFLTVEEKDAIAERVRSMFSFWRGRPAPVL